MALTTIATVATIAAAAASIASIGYQASQGAPKTPNLASSSREVAEATAESLPEQRRLAAAAQQGGKTTYTTAKHTERQLQQFVQPPNGKFGQFVPYNEADWKEGGKYYNPNKPDFQPKIRERTVKVRVPAGTKEADFTGFGTADVEGKLARDIADIQLDLSRKYGTQFAEEGRKAAELSDPEGTAARKLEYEMINREMEKPSPINPLSTSLDKSIEGQLRAGSGLDPQAQELLDAAIARANADRGDGLEAALVERAMSEGNEGQARREAAFRKSGAWLSSGSTPEDIAYRREQQNISNLGAFVSGQTPHSQFQNIAGAGRGATPFVPGAAPPQLPQNAGAAGGPYAVNAYQAKINQAANQANPWLAGMSTLLTGISAFGNTKPTG